jgi:KaiC/GvpD/RAD55 family RecA-like ATPase
MQYWETRDIRRKSAVLAVGAPGIGKEALGYWFTYSGLKKRRIDLPSSPPFGVS